MKIKDMEKFKNRMQILVMGAMLNFTNFTILQIGSRAIWQYFSLEPLYALVNFGILTAVIALLYACTNKLWLSEAICSGVYAIYAVIDVYVVEFHGTPLTIPEFANTKTALNVITGYSFIKTKPLIFLATICVLSIINVILIKKIRKKETSIAKKLSQKKFSWGIRVFIFVCGYLYIVGILQIDYLIKPVQEGWRFNDIVGQYGHPLYFLVSGLEYEVTAPSGYSEENLASVSLDEEFEDESDTTIRPDIILILNETFYDVSLVSDAKTDVDYMGTFFDMENTISGHTVVPKIGGSTNKSEYELLTANSTYLMQGITPFQVMDVSETASIISNLKELDYYTIASHPAASGNYNRNTGYSRLGFDEIHFKDDFIDREYYGTRNHITDACAYKYLIEWYENALQTKGQKPIFSYLLTIQNHGGWTANEPSEDIVHVTNYDDSPNKDELSEYLSCITLSVDAFKNLTEYFQNSERPVIICMAGDHAPIFIEEITDKKENLPILQRATPFVIWANFPIEEKREVMISMNELAPLLLDTAGVKMLPYFRYILNLGQDVPVLTSYGNYIDKAGNIYSYSDNTQYSDKIQEYFWLEYNNLQKTSLSKWFSVQAE